MTKRLVISQPYVPKYRLPFFSGLINRLAQEDIECVVAAGKPTGNQARRGDSTSAKWLLPTKTRSLDIRKSNIDFWSSPCPWKNTDAVILGLEGSAIPVYAALLSQMTGGAKVGVWGHVAPYVTSGNKIDLALEKWQMRTANHVFAYTAGGREYALRNGLDPQKITTVMNTIDTTALERILESLTQSDLLEELKHIPINLNKTVCFIGGLDDSKRTDFLGEALDFLWKNDPEINVLVGGDGPGKKHLNKAFRRHQAHYMGYLDTRKKALVLAASKYILMPGRIGLVAVDALVARKPIITTDWRYHAPEAEYLTEGISRITTKNTPSEYAIQIVELLGQDHGNSLFRSPEHAWEYPGMDEMVNNFTNGVKSLLAG